MGMLGVRLGLAYAYQRENEPPEPPEDDGKLILAIEDLIVSLLERFRRPRTLAPQ